MTFSKSYEIIVAMYFTYPIFLSLPIIKNFPIKSLIKKRLKQIKIVFPLTITNLAPNTNTGLFREIINDYQNKFCHTNLGPGGKVWHNQFANCSPYFNLVMVERTIVTSFNKISFNQKNFQILSFIFRLKLKQFENLNGIKNSFKLTK